MKKLQFSILILISAVLVFAGCAPNKEVHLNQTKETVSVHTALQDAYLNSEYTTIETYAKGMQELSFPQAVTLTWEPVDEEAEYVVEVSKSKDFSDTLTFTTYNNFIDVYNLFIGTQYYWRVSAKVNGRLIVGKEVGSFRTENKAPRNLFIDGITNARDLGGWQNTEGVKVKQGLLYRTGRLNSSFHPDIASEITEFGIGTMRDTLGIKSEIDLRRNYQNENSFMRKSLLGEDVNYYACPMEFDPYFLGTNTIDGNKELLQKIFTIFADESNYPIFFHCDIGTDRTGLIAYLVLGLLGVEEADIYRDYLFSNFGKIGSARDLNWVQTCYISTIKFYPGATISKKVENVLLDIGVKADELNAICNILLEKEAV